MAAFLFLTVSHPYYLFVIELNWIPFEGVCLGARDSLFVKFNQKHQQIVRRQCCPGGRPPAHPYAMSLVFPSLSLIKCFPFEGKHLAAHPCHLCALLLQLLQPRQVVLLTIHLKINPRIELKLTITQLISLRTPGSAEAGSEPSCKRLHEIILSMMIMMTTTMMTMMTMMTIMKSGEDPFSAKYAQAEHHRLEDCRVIIPPQITQVGCLVIVWIY